MKRRQLLHSSFLLGGSLGFQALLPAWAQSGLSNQLVENSVLSGKLFDLTVSQTTLNVAGKSSRAVLVNNQLPAPLLRWREGDDISIRVHNHLHEETSIHWHGILLPFQMDGVPGVSFPGIKSDETFTYQFPIKQSGTYWYHSHSNLQEQIGHYGPIIIDPLEEDPVTYDKEYVILLSDWTSEDPHRIFSKLKKMSDSYNFNQRTVGDFLHEVDEEGVDSALAARMMWGGMRMNDGDISDVSASTYTYLVNGHSPTENWTGLFSRGEKIRLRFINGSAMSIFNVRIPGLTMTVVQADGLNVQPVDIEEFQVGTAETFDVIVRPDENIAYTIMCETNDRSAYASGTLAPRLGMMGLIPPLRPHPVLSMKDMGMGQAQMNHMEMLPSEVNLAEMNHVQMDQADRGQSEKPLMSMQPEMTQTHDHIKGPGVVNIAVNPVNRLGERPLGLENEAHRVLVYTDLKSLEVNPDTREPGREIELHLTSNMERYMWSFDGIKFSEVDGPIEFKKGERLRLNMVNDTMMPHPVHLHGMFFELVTAEHEHKPRKHTVVIKPGEKMALDITADALGDWAFHCHLLYHMHAGMMRVVSVKDAQS